MSSLFAMCSMCMGLAALGAPVAESYAQLLARAARLEAEGRLADAVAVLEGAQARFPQDYEVSMRLAWLAYLQGRHEDAHRGYEQALALSGQGSDAQLGRGYVHLALGEPTAARADFAAVLEGRPEHEGARAGLEAARAAWPRFFASAVGTGQLWSGHRAKRLAGVASVGLVARAAGWLHLEGRYRGGEFRVRDDQAADAPLYDFPQHEAWATAGYDAPALAALATYAYAYPRGHDDYRAHVAALSLRISRFGDLWIDGAVTVYDELVLPQAGIEWRLPLGLGFSVTPEARGQWPGGGDGGGWAGELTLAWFGARAGVWLGGIYGREVRPVSLRPQAIYNIPEEVREGVRAGVQVTLTRGWDVFSEYELRVLEADDGARTTLHLLSLGMALER
jgi:tetratricopeptide (TPR) repeat protein